MINEDQLQWNKKMALNTLRTLCSQWVVKLIIRPKSCPLCVLRVFQLGFKQH